MKSPSCLTEQEKEMYIALMKIKVILNDACVKGWGASSIVDSLATEIQELYEDIGQRLIDEWLELEEPDIDDMDS